MAENKNFDKSQYQFILDKKLKPLINYTKKIREFNIEVCLYQILIEMKDLSSKTGLPVVAEIKGEKVEITALTNISSVYNSLKTKSKKNLKNLCYEQTLPLTILLL